MSFNSQFPADNTPRPQNEAALPDDLAILADELTASAAHLASMYPAPNFIANSPTPPALLPTPGWRAPRLSSALVVAAGVAALLLVASVAWQLNSGPETPPSSATQLAQSEPAPLQPSRNMPAVGHPPSNSELQQAQELSPSALFHELSAPELEGMLDLLEQQPPREARLSI